MKQKIEHVTHLNINMKNMKQKIEHVTHLNINM